MIPELTDFSPVSILNLLAVIKWKRFKNKESCYGVFAAVGGIQNADAGCVLSGNNVAGTKYISRADGVIFIFCSKQKNSL